MSSYTEFVIKDDGTLRRREVIEHQLNLTQAIVDQFTTSVVRKIPGLLPMSLIDPKAKGMMSMSVGGGNFTTACMPIYDLPLKAPFALDNGVVFPHFDGNQPVMALRWNVAESMRIVLAVQLQAATCIQQYLVAFDGGGRSWRLPLSNLYDDCKLCAGRYAATAAPSILEACRLAWQQFEASAWNQDLYTDSTRREPTRKMFSYKVSNDSFTQIPMTSDWTTLCQKVATEYITNNVIP